VSELAEEQELRDLFERFGRVTRVFLARDRDTQKAKGFAFISFADRADAARACEKMDGCKLLEKTKSQIDPYANLCFSSWLPPSYPSRRVREEDFLSSCLLSRGLEPFLRWTYSWLKILLLYCMNLFDNDDFLKGSELHVASPQ